MADQNETAALESQDSQLWLHKAHLDTKLLGQAVIELNIARKNYAIYPSGHVQLARSIDRAYQVLKRLMEPTPRLTLGVARDSLFLGESYLDQKNPVFKDFALALYGRDIAAISFNDALTRDDVLSLCQILGRDMEEIREAGGIQQLTREKPIPGIELKPLGFSRLHFTEEEEIFGGAGGSGSAKPDGQLWHSFVNHLIAGHLDSDGNAVSFGEKQKINPRHLAEMLNDGLFNLKAAIQSYEATIARYLRETTGDQPLEKLITLLRNLSPKLRGQFLSVTFEHVVGSGCDEVLSSFPDDLAMEMLQEANDEGREISPTLMLLLDRISRIETAAALPGRKAPGTASCGTGGGKPSREQMAALFDRESYEDFVDSNYQDLLKDLIKSSSSHQASRGFSKPGEAEAPGGVFLNIRAAEGRERGDDFNKYLESMNDSHVNLRLGRMMVAILDGGMDPDEYGGFSRFVIQSVPEFLSWGEFDLCLEILEMFRTHAVEKEGLVQGAAREALVALKSEHVANAAAEALDECSPERLQQAVSFVSQLGAPCIPRMLELFAQDEYPSKRKSLLDLLLSAGRRASEEACIRFQGAPVHVIRNLLLLVQKIGDRGSLPCVQVLTTHENTLVRMDALVTLLELRDPDVSIHLRRALHAIDEEESSRAIALAGFYRESTVVDDLLGIIRPFPWARSGHRKNAEVVRSLGRIGDVRAIPMLEKLAGQRFSLYPRQLGLMKHVLFESVAGYPLEHLGRLLKAGEKSRDGRIRIMMERLAHQKAAGSPDGGP